MMGGDLFLATFQPILSKARCYDFALDGNLSSNEYIKVVHRLVPKRDLAC